MDKELSTITKSKLRLNLDYLASGFLGNKPQAILKLVDAPDRVATAVEINQGPCLSFCPPGFPRQRVQDANRDGSMRTADGREFHLTDGVDSGAGKPVKSKDFHMSLSLDAEALDAPEF